MYRLLEVGEEILPTDEFYRDLGDAGEWVPSTFKYVTKPVFHRADNPPVRRRIESALRGSDASVLAEDGIVEVKDWRDAKSVEEWFFCHFTDEAQQKHYLPFFRHCWDASSRAAERRTTRDQKEAAFRFCERLANTPTDRERVIKFLNCVDEAKRIVGIKEGSDVHTA